MYTKFRKKQRKNKKEEKAIFEKSKNMLFYRRYNGIYDDIIYLVHLLLFYIFFVFNFSAAFHKRMRSGCRLWLL